MGLGVMTMTMASYAPTRFDTSKYERGDDVTVYDSDNRSVMTILYYYDSEPDPDTFGDGGAYSIIEYPLDVSEGPFDHGVLSGYETPGDVVDDLCGKNVYKVVDDAADNDTGAALCAWLASEHGMDLSKYVNACINEH